MASVRFQPTENFQIATCSESNSNDENECIPYHAREHARPFTYGTLPENFNTSSLRHVPSKEASDMASPMLYRKSTRPSVTPSPPVLRKTPSRQEFEEMVQERCMKAEQDKDKKAIKTKQKENGVLQKNMKENKYETLNTSDYIGIAKPSSVSVKYMAPKNLLVENQDTNSDVSSHNLTDALKIYDPAPIIDEIKRPETPTFPVNKKLSLEERCATPYAMISSTLNSSNSPFVPLVSISKSEDMSPVKIDINSGVLHEVEAKLMNFAKDLSEFWYYPHMTREEAVAILRNALPGTFIIRKSNTYKNAYGLVLRVVKPPVLGISSGSSEGDELVRHFLLESSSRGIHMKGCQNEPVFTCLSAFVYEHSINQHALPVKLIIPDRDSFCLHLSGNKDFIAKQKRLYQQGAACNVLYLFTCPTESLTGDEAIRKAIFEMYQQQPPPTPTEVHIKISKYGITLTDNKRRIFFRRHYTSQNISHVGIDPENRIWQYITKDGEVSTSTRKNIFGFVARPLTVSTNNECLILCDLDRSQPASAIVSFAHKVLLEDKHIQQML